MQFWKERPNHKAIFFYRNSLQRRVLPLVYTQIAVARGLFKISPVLIKEYIDQDF
jgi:hypothetical protein